MALPALFPGKSDCRRGVVAGLALALALLAAPAISAHAQSGPQCRTICPSGRPPVMDKANGLCAATGSDTAFFCKSGTAHAVFCDCVLKKPAPPKGDGTAARAPTPAPAGSPGVPGNP